MEPPLVSVIVPTFNEEQALPGTLDVLARLHGRFEILVVDGGSSDATVTIARQRGVRLLQVRRGRGGQLRAGARVARGGVLWFVHADTHPAVDALAHVHKALARPGVVGGNFQVWFSGRQRAARFLTWLYPRLRLLGLCYGDSAIFVRRRDYDAVGGIRAQALFEDLDLVRRLRQRGRFVQVRSTVVASTRRLEGRSFTRTFLGWVLLQLLYALGVSPAVLDRWYAPLRGRGRRPRKQEKVEPVSGP